MSVYATNEYIISTNNFINENKYNKQKMKNSGIKALLKPLMRIIKKTTKRSQKKQCCYDTSYEDDQNTSNESLERKIIEEIESCQPGSAILIYNEANQCEILPVTSEKTFVPVHFARTEAGTFFWTSYNKATEYDFVSAGHCYTECQDAEEQIPLYRYDRWVQA